MWKDILKSRELLKGGLIWKVGKGDQISFWFDNWIENRCRVDLIDIDESNVTHPDARVGDFITQGSKWGTSVLTSVLNNYPFVKKKKSGIPKPFIKEKILSVGD